MKLKKIKVKPKKTKAQAPDKPPITWQEISQKYGRWILIGEVVLILAIGIFFIVKPKYDEVTSDTDGGLTYWQEKLDKVEKDLVSAKKLVKLYNDLNKSEREKLFKILPTGDNIPQLMSQLEALFTSEELFLSDLTLTPREPPAGTVTNLKLLEIQMTITAPQDYYHFKQVLEKIESNIRVLSIENISYTPDMTSLQINAQAYYIE